MLINKWLAGVWALLLSTGNTAPFTQPKILEKLDSIPEGWYQGDSVPAPDQQIKLQIAVRQEDKHALLEERLFSVSTPGHTFYGQHYDPEQLSAVLQPDPVVSDAILSWLQEEGIPEIDIEDNGDWFNIHTTIAQAENLLDTKFQYFHHRNAAVPPRIRTLQYSVPHDLHQFIQLIQPTTHFSHVRPYQVGGEPVPIPKYGPGSATKLNATCELSYASRPVSALLPCSSHLQALTRV
jgi:tripeptidyl-peptidase-1